MRSFRKWKDLQHIINSNLDYIAINNHYKLNKYFITDSEVILKV